VKKSSVVLIWRGIKFIFFLFSIIIQDGWRIDATCRLRCPRHLPYW
jgi:hypothetical protein